VEVIKLLEKIFRDNRIRVHPRYPCNPRSISRFIS